MAVAEKTQPATPSGSKYVDFDEFIEYQLRRTRNGIHQTDLLVAGIVLTCLVLGYLLVFTLFDHWVIAGGFSWIARVSLLAGLVTSVIGLGVWKLLLPYLRHINTLYAAREIERAHPELKNSLVSLVDLRRIGREVSPAILKALEKRAATEMSHADLEQAVDRKTLMRSAYVLLAIVVVMGTYTLISPKKLSTSIWRALFPTSAIAVSTTTEIVQVTPGNTEVLARSQLDVTADLAGKIPEEVTLVFSTADRRFVDEAIVMRNTGEDLPRYRARLTGDQGAGLLSNVAYRIVAGDAESPTFHITVNQPPTAAVSEVRYEYPDYMLLDEKTSSSANIDAWEGTWVTVRAKANMPVTKAIIKTSDTEDISLEAEEYPMQVDGTDLTCRWQLKFRREDGTFADYYHIQLWNEKEENDPQPTVHRIKIRPDQKPEINLIHPVSDIEAPANAVVPIVFEAHDPDFMLRRVDLKLERDGEVLGTSPRLLQAPPFVSELNQTYRLKLEDYLLKPGDQMTFYIEAHDNRALIDGYGDDMTRTSKVTITVIEPQEPEQVKAFEAEQEREAQQRLLEENPERNERQPRPQEEKQPNQKQPQDGEMGEDGDAGEAAEKEGQPGEKGAQETSDPNAADGQTTKPSPDGSQQTQDGTNNNSDMPPEDGMAEGTDSGNNSQPREDGQQNQPSGTDNGGQKKQDKAAEDQALRELLEWNKRQQEKEKNQQPNPESQQQPENQDQSDPSKPDQNQTSKDNSSSDTDAAPNDNKASDQKSDPSQSMPEDGANSNSSMSEDSQDGETSSSSDATNNDSNASQPDANKPEKASDPSENNSEKSTSDGSPSGKGQESDSMDDKGTDQAQPGEVGPDAKSESGDKPPSENMKDGTGEGEKTRQAADPDTQPGEKTERGDPSEIAKPSQNKNNDNNQSNENNGTQDSQDSQKSNSSDQKQNDPSMKGNESNSDSQQQKSNDPKSSPDQNSNPSSTDTSQSKGDPNSQSSDKPGQQPSQSDSKSSDSQSQDSKSPSQSSSDSKSSDSEPKGDSSDQNSSSQDNSMKNEDGQSSKNSDDQQSKSSEPGKGSPKGSSDQQNQSDQKDADSNSQQESNSDSKQNDDGNSKQSDSKDGGQKGNQDGNQSGKQSSDGQSDPQNPQPGNQMGKGSNSPTPQSPTAGGGTGRADGDAGGTDAGDGVGPEAEAADLESKKKATSLALKRLQEQLERGETPQELLDDLGYNEQDLEKFMQRLEQRLSETAQTPESEASRRQFESLLKGIDYKSRGDVRKGNNNGDAAQGFGSGNRPVPPEFRLEQEAYKRKLSRQSASDK